MRDNIDKRLLIPTVGISDSGNAIWYLPDGMDWYSQDINPN